MIKYRIYELLKDMAKDDIKKFSPVYICERLCVDNIKLITCVLINNFKDILKVNYEVECPNGDSDFIVDDISLIKDEMRICHHCGQEYVPNPKNIWITFNFKSDFKNYIKKSSHNIYNPVKKQCNPDTSLESTNSYRTRART